MSHARFQNQHPVLPVRDVPDAIRYYTEQLGFRLRFQDDPSNPKYAGVERDAVCFHLQWHDPVNFRDHVDAIALRFVIDDVDSLFAEYSDKGVFHAQTEVRNTAWGTREFAFYDPDGNALFFYRNV